MGMKKEILDRYEALVRANAEKLEAIRRRDQRTWELEQALAKAEGARGPATSTEAASTRTDAQGPTELQVAQAEAVELRGDLRQARKERDNALERVAAVARQLADLRVAAGCVEGSRWSGGSRSSCAGTSCRPQSACARSATKRRGSSPAATSVGGGAGRGPGGTHP